MKDKTEAGRKNGEKEMYSNCVGGRTRKENGDEGSEVVSFIGGETSAVLFFEGVSRFRSDR